MATDRPEQIEEERRLLYVAMTRAKNALHVVHPQRFFIRQQHRRGDRHVYTPVTRFIPETIRARFEQVGHTGPNPADGVVAQAATRINVVAALRRMWD